MENKEGYIYSNYTKVDTISINGKDYPVEYEIVQDFGRRSNFDGRPLSIGATLAKVIIDGKEHVASSECSVREPFVKENGELVALGKLLKQFGLRLRNGKIIER